MLSLLVLVKCHALPALKDRTITSNSNKCSLHALAPLPLSYLHLGRLLPATDGVVFKGELVLTNDGPAVLVSHVGHHVHVRGPQLKLPLPVDDGGQGGAHQEGPFGVALGPSGRGKDGQQAVALIQQMYCYHLLLWRSMCLPRPSLASCPWA